jgi:maltodextrin utilization protein YvdJ
MWIMNKTNISTFHKFEEAPAPVQLAISILPAMMALQVCFFSFSFIFLIPYFLI